MAVDSGGAGGARAPPEFWGSEKGRSLISAYWSLAIPTSTPGIKKLSMTLSYRPTRHRNSVNYLKNNVGVVDSANSQGLYFKARVPLWPFGLL